MQDAPNLDELIPLNSFVLYRNFKALQFSDKMKPPSGGPFKIINKTDVIFRMSLMKY